LEGSGTVCHSEEHHEGFKEAAIGAEGHLPFISRLDMHIVEIPADDKFCEVLGSVELGDKFGDEGERVLVLDGYSVQHMIVLDQLERAIFLLNEEHRGCYGGLGRSYLSSVTPLENFLWKYNMGYTLYPWISLLESTLEISYKPQT